MPNVLVATWLNGVFAFTGDTFRHAFADQSVRGLARNGRGDALAIVGGHSLRRRAPDEEWETIATSELELSCCVAVGDDIYVGTDDARLLRLTEHSVLEELSGFETVHGRDKWYAGAAVIDGQLMGPPLGIRSMAASCDNSVIFANVHVGGVPRSADGGLSWSPTIDIDNDVHQVCAHPTRPDTIIAAAASGLCISRDGGETWSVEREGLHDSYCSAVAFAGDDILVAASSDHFASQGAIYRRALDATGPLLPLGGGLPRWLEGIADTGCIAAHGLMAAVIDKAGHLYISEDAGASWLCGSQLFPMSSGLLIV
jgi:hypothetical protein